MTDQFEEVKEQKENRVDRQKWLGMMVLMNILQRERYKGRGADCDHPISMRQLVGMMAEYGIETDERTIHQYKRTINSELTKAQKKSRGLLSDDPKLQKEIEEQWKEDHELIGARKGAGLYLKEDKASLLMPVFRLSEDESNLLRGILRKAVSEGGPYSTRVLDSLIGKIASTSDQQLRMADERSSIYYFTPWMPEWSAVSDMIHIIQEAIVDSAVIEFDYRSYDVTGFHKAQVKPCRIMFGEGRFYLIGEDLNDPKHLIKKYKLTGFRVQNIRKALVESGPYKGEVRKFEYDPDFNVNDQCGQFGIFQPSKANPIKTYTVAVRRDKNHVFMDSNIGIPVDANGNETAEWTELENTFDQIDSENWAIYSFQRDNEITLFHRLLAMGDAIRLLEPEEAVSKFEHDIFAIASLYREQSDKSFSLPVLKAGKQKKD